VRTRSASRLLVDLVDRHEDRDPAAFAWSTAPCVCGFTPSSAATTITAMFRPSAAGAHRGDRLVARRVEEGDDLSPWCTW
jgi:hypothetical protein